MVLLQQHNDFQAFQVNWQPGISHHDAQCGVQVNLKNLEDKSGGQKKKWKVKEVQERDTTVSVYSHLWNMVESLLWIGAVGNHVKMNGNINADKQHQILTTMQYHWESNQLVTSSTFFFSARKTQNNTLSVMEWPPQSLDCYIITARDHPDRK